MKTLRLQDEEITALINWHLDEKQRAINIEDFSLAEIHRKRALELARVQAERP